MNLQIYSITKSSKLFPVLVASAQRLAIAVLLCSTLLMSTVLAQNTPQEQTKPQDSPTQTPLSKGVLPMTRSTSQTDFTITDDEIVFTSPGVPDYLRAIRLTDNLGYLSIFSTDLSGSPGAAIHMAGNGTSTPGHLYFDSGAHDSAALIFRTAQTGGVIEERLRITSAGNVGVGTASPGSKLTVNGVIESTSGGMKFPDGTVQATATLQGAPGPQGPAGPQGSQGPQGPAGSLTLPFGGTVSTSSDALNVSNNGTGNALVAATSGLYGVRGTAGGLNGAGVRGAASNGPNAYGVWGLSSTGFGVVGNGGTNTGVYGIGDSIGVRGEARTTGVLGTSVNDGGGSDGVLGRSTGVNSNGVSGEAHNGANAYGIWGRSSSGFAGYFNGRVNVAGTLSKTAGSFKIDHPLDPANKYLSHSFVESPDMMNIYNGVATLNEQGETVIQLPDWFQALNRDFRYQLTAIGAPAPNLYIAEKVVNNRFKIAGGVAGMEVSWQVTGIRQDEWATKHRIPVEELKPASERGFYIHPELFNAPEEKAIEWAHKPEAMKRLKEEREKQIKETQEKLKVSPQP